MLGNTVIDKTSIPKWIENLNKKPAFDERGENVHKYISTFPSPLWACQLLTRIHLDQFIVACMTYAALNLENLKSLPILGLK